MAVTYGFYNALNHDRLYDAIQMSSIFDGIIRDGIFSTIGDTMIVTAPEDGMYVNVGSGRAWFNHTWTLNDTDYPIEAEQAEVVLDRIDAVILEVNSSAEVRANSIKFLKGTPSTNPVKPTLTHNAEVNQYALAYVRIKAGQTTIFQSDIENAVGTDETPFITGVLQQVSIETLLKQWETEFNTYFTNFQDTSTTEFDDWFQRMKDQLSQDAAGNLQLQIDDIADEKANNDIISDAWNASTTYAVGQYCIYNNSLWKCLVQHSGQTPTEGTYWTKVTVANEITSVNNSFQWKLIGSAKGKTPITLPSNFSEILVIVKANNENYNFNIPKLYLDETNKMFSHGKGLHISGATYLVQIRIIISTNNVALNDARGSQNASITDYSSKSVTTAYYR